MNSLKTFMNKVGDRVREVAPQTSLNIVDGTDPNDEAVEGFVCPTCYLRFSTPETLEKHYSEEHLDPSANYLCPVCKARLNSQAELELHYTSNHGERDFNGQSLEVLKEELIELSTSLREERWYSEELKKEVERFQEAFKKKEDNEDAAVYVDKSQLDAVEESKSMLSKEGVMLRKQLSESIEQNGILRGERDSLEIRASEFAVERAELRATLDSLQTEKVGIESELHDFRSSSCNQQTNDKLEIANLSQETFRLQSVINTKLKEIQSQKERELALQRDLKHKSESLASLKEEMRHLKVEVDLMKKKVQDKSDDVCLLTSQLKECKEQIVAMADNPSPSGDSALNNEKMPSSAIQDQSEELKDRLIQDKDEEINRLKSHLSQAEKDIKNAEDLAKEKLKFIDNANDKVALVTNSLNEVKSKAIELETIVWERDKIVDDLSEKLKEIIPLNAQIEEKEKLLITAREGKQQDLVKLKDAEEKVSTLEKTLQITNEQIQGSLLSNEATKIELENVMKILGEKTSSMESLGKKLIDITEINSKINAQLSEVNVIKENMTYSIDSLKSELSSLKNKIDASQSKMTCLEEDLETSTQQSTNQTNRISLLEEDLSQREKAFQHQSDDMSNQIADLEQKCNSMKEQQDTLNAELLSEATSKEKARDETLKLSQQVESLNYVIKEKDAAATRSFEQLKKIEDDQETLRKEYTTLCEALQSTRDKLNSSEEEIYAQSVKVAELESGVVAQEAEIAGLAGDKLELEVKVESAADEQSSLVERCLAAEAEVERLQVQLTQLRRKLDDSTAALHELGRENQSLQMETSKLSGRKWAEDSEALNCSQCSKIFSITIRRHHCRNCGQIFCGECSSKQAPLDSNKRPVRVCDSCHAELLTKI